MIYRVTVLIAVLLAVVGLAAPAYAANQRWTIKGGSCKGPITCDSIALGLIDGHVGVLFLNGSEIVIGFSGDLIGNDGPLFFPTRIRLADGKDVSVAPGGHNNSCHFYFNDHGAFTPGWEHRLTSIECVGQGRNVTFGSGPYFNGPAVLSVVPNVVQEQSAQKIVFHVTAVRSEEAHDGGLCTKGECDAKRFTVEGYSVVRDNLHSTEYVLQCLETLVYNPSAHFTTVCDRLHVNNEYDARRWADNVVFGEPSPESSDGAMRLAYEIVSEKEVNKQKR